MADELRSIIASQFRNTAHTIPQIFDAIEAIKRNPALVIDPRFQQVIDTRSTWGLCEYIEKHFKRNDKGIIQFEEISTVSASPLFSQSIIILKPNDAQP